MIGSDMSKETILLGLDTVKEINILAAAGFDFGWSW